ncbi:RecB family exonuclease [Saxibacter everestensis]|uniref:RecB family exonuclease n=1 Tax=Saxibacter everestensis TaxID=2909229 RepID=A0ABY8QXI8_9MICO|nr:RecB family exonuclease [Brevibacteriaceae bacterium ZFBP1038]
MPELNALSPSRANDFMQCPLLFRFRAIDKLPEPPSLAALKGTMVHSALENLFELASTERTQEAAVALLEPAWAELVGKDPAMLELFADQREFESWLASARELVASYFTLEYPQALEPAEREVYVETTLDFGLRIRGYIDRLDIAPTGDLRVVDYKTGKAPPPAFSAKALFQMKFYALAIFRIRGVLPHTLQLFYLGSKDVIRYRPTEADMRVTEQKIESIWNEIKAAAESGNWRPQKSKLCDWCHYKPLCPAWGGTPPEPPEVTIGSAASSESEPIGTDLPGTGAAGPEVDLVDARSEAPADNRPEAEMSATR